MEKQDKTLKIKVQIEYYLSDENLEKDKFFHDQISKNSLGYLSIDFFLNCNNLKKLAATKQDIIEAVQASSVVELNADNTCVRRRDNKMLPELKLLKNKRKASCEDNRNDEESEDESNMDNVILKIWSVGDTEVKWKTISEVFKKENKALNVCYMRFSKSLGHIGIHAKRNEPFKFTEKLTIENEDFTIEKCEGDDLINFWKEHGKHFEMCTSDNNRKKGINKKKELKKKQASDRLREPVSIAGERFDTVGKIRARSRGILNLTKDGDKIIGKDHDFLKELLVNHKSGEAKLKDMAYFTVGQPKDFNNSRCFFITKNDNSKEDFSVHKCLEKFLN